MGDIEHHLVPQVLVGVQQLLQDVLFGRLRNDGEGVLQRIFQAPQAIMGRHRSNRRRLLLRFDLDAWLLLDAQNFAIVIFGERVAIVEEHFSTQNENRAANQQVFGLVILGNFGFGKLEVNRRVRHWTIRINLQKNGINLRMPLDGRNYFGKLSFPEELRKRIAPVVQSMAFFDRNCIVGEKVQNFVRTYFPILAVSVVP